MSSFLFGPCRILYGGFSIKMTPQPQEDDDEVLYHEEVCLCDGEESGTPFFVRRGTFLELLGGFESWIDGYNYRLYGGGRTRVVPDKVSSTWERQKW